MAANVFDRAFGHHFTAEATGTRPEVDDMVRSLDGVLVMLHDDDRIPQIPEPAKRCQQALVVALMQPDARLIEDVEDAYETRADLSSEADALGLSAGQRCSGSPQSEVVETNVAQKSKSVDNFLENRTCNIRVEAAPSI